MSMTGFGRGEAHGEAVSVTADIRTVNHRYLDVHVKAPGKFVAWEPRIRGLARETLRRGKVDIFINVREWGGSGGNLRVNRPLLAGYLAEAARLKDEYGISPEISFGELVRIPIFSSSIPKVARTRPNVSGPSPKKRSAAPSRCSSNRAGPRATTFAWSSASRWPGWPALSHG
jgi:uncharacterized protein YicC (UPF0701 family)